MEHKRTNTYRKSPKLEHYLQQMNDSLKMVDQQIEEELEGPAKPLIFIVGAQRSGTTYLSQLIINNCEVSYPSNMIARFWEAPLAGTMLFKSLYKDKNEVAFSSDLGYTSGPEGPHEFGYFWKKYLDVSGKADEQKLEALSDKLTALTQLTKNAWIFKNLHYVDFNILHLNRIYSKTYFIHLKRDLIDTALSTYRSRIKLFGSEDSWMGVKPSNYSTLQALSPPEQIILQIDQTHKDIEGQLSALPKDRVLGLEYKDLIKNVNQVKEQLQGLCPEIKWNSASLIFDSRNPQSTSSEENKLREKFEAIAKQYGLISQKNN